GRRIFHVHISVVVPSLRAVLAAGAAGIGALSHCVALAAALPHHRNCGSRGSGTDLGSGDAPSPHVKRTLPCLNLSQGRLAVARTALARRQVCCATTEVTEEHRKTSTMCPRGPGVTWRPSSLGSYCR